ncbi:hypothetical protein B0H14DRAFT_2826098 [Mycena olivaceomarginata]|nr:hypothetical protein B0H14DRAFT_2826098 [Mycena olivaceomarginata]
MPLDAQAVSSSMSGITVSPRTPKFTHRMGRDDEADDEDERHQAGRGLDVEEQSSPATHSLSNEDKRAMVLFKPENFLLTQPPQLGLALGVFCDVRTISGYPYSLKLLWSPIVDSVSSWSVGRRKSWIIPMQLVVGTIMLYLSLNVQVLMDDASNHVNQLTFLFTSLVFFLGYPRHRWWALTLLSHESLSYASTCQTIGLNTGFFALSREAFTTKWGVPHLTLSAYLKFWCKEKEALSDADMSIKAVYKQIWAICKLRHVQLLIIVHFFAKVGWLSAGRDLAIAVLIDFPFQIAGGWLAANWSRGDHPLRPWLVAFWAAVWVRAHRDADRVLVPQAADHDGILCVLVIHTVFSSFTSQFLMTCCAERSSLSVSLRFHTRVSDPLIGGTYMTLLNTFTNLGGTWPKYFVLKGVDLLTEGASELVVKATECVSEEGKTACTEAGGQCIIETDGYYMIFCALPTSAWRVKMS